eukprot:COSAG02_NODE_7305_length_3073_cov_11.716543_3_plen_69_part_00
MEVDCCAVSLSLRNGPHRYTPNPCTPPSMVGSVGSVQPGEGRAADGNLQIHVCEYNVKGIRYDEGRSV